MVNIIAIIIENKNDTNRIPNIYDNKILFITNLIQMNTIKKDQDKFLSWSL